ncbi:MAG: helix-turn-helix domain-containing protein [Candidatus Aenigmatarchaeota archaeon]
MMKGTLVDSAERLLEENGWVTARYHGCFDIAAKKRTIVLVKILQNIDALSEGQAKNLRIVAESVEGSAMLMGEQTRVEMLKRGVVYERFGIPTVNFRTFERLITEGVMPSIYRDKGGLYVRVDSEALREARGEKGLTQRELAEMVGVNKKAIYEHERSELRMALRIAERLEDALGKRLMKDINLVKKIAAPEQSEPKDVLEKDVGGKLRRIGFDVKYVGAAPFDILAKEKALVLSDVEADKRKLLKRAPALRGFAAVTQKPVLMITEKAKEEELEGVPVIRRSELKEMERRDVLRAAKRMRKKD